MTEVISPARPRRNIELVLLLAALAIALGADLLGTIGTDAEGAEIQALGADSPVAADLDALALTLDAVEHALPAEMRSL